MRRVTRGRERGAVAVILAILLAGGVIMAALAVSVDVGNVMYERRQLQNAADASSLALAQMCAKEPASCSSDPLDEARLLAAKNAADGAMTLDAADVCASSPLNGTLGVGECTSAGSISNLRDCTPKPDWLKAGIPYVETRPRTQSTTGGNSSILPTFFSRLVAGGSEGAGYTACARAAWGPLGSSKPSLPLVMGLCNWNLATANGTRFMESMPYSPAPNTNSAVPSLKDKSGVIHAPQDFLAMIFGGVNGSETDIVDKFPCTPDLQNPPGKYGPGGFGWLKTCKSLGSAEPLCEDQNVCFAPIIGSGTAGGDPGSSVPTDCKDELKNFVGHEVDVPVVTAVAGTGAGLTYTVKGISTFFLAGYHNVNSAQPPDKNGYRPDVAAYADKACMLKNKKGVYEPYKSTCVWGWFTSPIREVGSIDPSVPSRGPSVIQPAG